MQYLESRSLKQHSRRSVLRSKLLRFMQVQITAYQTERASLLPKMRQRERY